MLNLNHLITGLCRDYDFSYVESQGGYELFIDDITVRCTAASGKILLCAGVCELPGDEAGRLVAIQPYLRLALTHIKQYPVSVAIEQDALLIFYQVARGLLDARQFESLVSEFINAVELYRQIERAEPEVRCQTMLLYP